MTGISATLNLDRTSLSEFLPNPRAVREFETLVTTINEVTNIVINETPVAVGDVAATANASDAQLIALAATLGQEPPPHDTTVIETTIAGLLQTPAPYVPISQDQSTRTITASANAIPGDYFVAADCTGGAVTFTLPAAAAMRGKTLIAKKIDASGNALTVDADGAETIDGAANVALAAQYDAVTVISDGTQWWIL